MESLKSASVQCRPPDSQGAVRDAAGEHRGKRAENQTESVRADASEKKESRQFESADCADSRRFILTFRRKYFSKKVFKLCVLCGEKREVFINILI